MQTILGAGGTIGIELAKELKNYTDKIRLVSRSPKKVNDTDELFSADISDKQQLENAIKGSEIVYITVGFEYSTKVWQEKWPPLIKNTIEICKKNNIKLVFFDNVYMYDPNYMGHMTEETPIRPISKKGIIRAHIATLITDAVGRGEITALIARAADFYGEDVKTSILQAVVYDNFLKNKSANWIVNSEKIHNFTYTPDAGKATALLGNTPDAYNQVWHLPTDNTKLTGKQWVELFAKEMNRKAKIMILPKWLMGLLGIFVPIMGEMKEMAYQYDRDYFFDSSKFEKRFGINAIKPEKAVHNIVHSKKEN